MVLAATACVIVNVSEAPAGTMSDVSDDQLLTNSALTLTKATPKSHVFVFVTCTIILPVEASPIVKSKSVSASSPMSKKPSMVSESIHAATAIETATVTAMRMMAATTRILKSFLIFVLLPPSSV